MTIPQELAAHVDGQIDGALSLGVGRLLTDGTLAGHKLNLSADAAAGFRDQCRRVAALMESRRAVQYGSGAELGDDEYFVADDLGMLDELVALETFRTSIETMPSISPSELDLTIQLYGVSVGDGSDRLLFVRRANPKMTFAAGRFFAVGRDRLVRVDEPTFSFDARFDFVMGEGWIAILDQHSFEMLFRTIGVVEKNISTWIEGITDHLPMADASVEALRSVAMRDSRTWRRLREIEHRGHLADVTLDEVREYATMVGLEPDKIVSDGELVFDPAERFSFLHLLNEDLYRGHLTDEPFEAQRKTATGT